MTFHFSFFYLINCKLSHRFPAGSTQYEELEPKLSRRAIMQLPIETCRHGNSSRGSRNVKGTDK